MMLYHNRSAASWKTSLAILTTPMTPTRECGLSTTRTRRETRRRRRQPRFLHRCHQSRRLLHFFHRSPFAAPSRPSTSNLREQGTVHTTVINTADSGNHASLSCEDDSQADPVPGTSGDIETRAAGPDHDGGKGLVQLSPTSASPDVEMRAGDRHEAQFSHWDPDPLYIISITSSSDSPPPAKRRSARVGKKQTPQFMSHVVRARKCRGGLLRYEVEGVASSRGTSAKTCSRNRNDKIKERRRRRNQVVHAGRRGRREEGGNSTMLLNETRALLYIRDLYLRSNESRKLKSKYVRGKVEMGER
ncbi:hypothetical protein V8E53_005825 [Lactarius tabidus]